MRYFKLNLNIVHIHLVSPEYLQETMVIICVVIDCTDR